jgi:MFS-type transporter involved in bile tolerance (Atg22 family)
MVISCIGFWASLVFYNSYLPDLVPESQRDRVSARGFTWGYIGSVLLQIICFVIVFLPEMFGLTTPYEKRLHAGKNIICTCCHMVVRLRSDSIQSITVRQY